MVARMRQRMIRFGATFGRTPGGEDRAPTGTETAEHPRLAARALEHAQLVDRILKVNPTACADFLAEFPRPALERYLDRLDALETPRGPEARWVRTADTPAIVVCQGEDRLD